MRRIFVLTLIATFISITLSFAQTGQIKQDFAVLNGVIIMPVAGEYLIDLDISSGINEGDILTLVTEGEKIIHPVSKEVLGTLDVAVGYLSVTRIKTGYSYAKLISAVTPPRKGDRVKRFEQVPAAVDATVPAKIVKQLQADIPQLNWTGSDPLIHFSFVDDELVVHGSGDTIIKKYSLSEDVSTTVATQTSTPVVSDPFSIKSQADKSGSILNSAVNDVLGTVGLGKRDSRLETPGIIYSSQQNTDIWTSTPFPGKPVAVTVGDFDNDQQQEIALVVDNQLHIVRLNDGTISELSTVPFNSATSILGIDSIDINDDSVPEILINSVNDTGALNSRILQFDGSDYAIIAEKLPWYLRSLSLTGQRDELVGQQVNSPDNPFGGPLSVLNWTRNQLVVGRSLDLPAGTTIFALASFSSSGSENLYATLSPKDSLQIFSPQGDELWKSGDDFGGSETGFYARTESRDELIPFTYVQPKIAQLSADKIVVAQNDGTRVLQRYRNYDPSRIIALTWQGSMIKEVWHTMDQPAYLADLTVADADNDGEKELVTLVRFKGSDIISKSESHLVLYQLNKLQ